MFKGTFSTRSFLKRTDTLSTKEVQNHFDTLVFLNARFDTRVSVSKTRVFAHLRSFPVVFRKGPKGPDSVPGPFGLLVGTLNRRIVRGSANRETNPKEP